MPFGTRGNLHIVAKSDIGPFGPPQSEPLVMKWNPAWHVIPWLPWLLVGGLALYRPNRGRALWILTLLLVPVALSASSNNTVVEIAAPICFAVVFYFLSSAFLPTMKRNMALTFTLAIVVAGIASGFVIQTGASLPESQAAKLLVLLIWCALAELCFVLSVVAAIALSSRNFSFLRFNACLTFAFILMSAVATKIGKELSFMFLDRAFTLKYGPSMGPLPSERAPSFIVAYAIVLIACFACAIPPVLFMQLNREYRRRLVQIATGKMMVISTPETDQKKANQ